MLAAHVALGFDPRGLRDRSGRRVASAGRLLGAKRIHTAEGAIKKGLVTLDRLRATAILASPSASSLAAASAQHGCAAQAQNPSQTHEFNGSGYEAKVDVGKGAAEIGIDLGEGGVRAEIDFGLCEKNEDAFKAPDCPNAEGTLEASDQSEYFVNMRVFRGAELLVSQSLEFSAKTTIKPIQVDQDAKLEYFEIEHTYKNSVELGGSSQDFGRIGLKFTYHGSTRVNYPGATYDPTHTDVEVKFDVDGVEADQLHEVRDIEFDQSLAAKPEADRNFAAEVDKTIAKLGEKEANWNKPNACATITFDPSAETLTLDNGQAGGFRAEARSRDGGTPPGAKWTLTESQNASIRPPRALANPASFTYTVTKAGSGIRVRAAFRVVSQAGVAERTWTQPTKEPPPPPPPAEIFSGSISGTSVYDGDELGAGNELAAHWSGHVELKRAPAAQSPGTPATTYIYMLRAGSVIAYDFAGTISGCHVEGSAPIDLAAQPDLSGGAGLTLYDEKPRTYFLLIPAPLLITVHGTTSACEDSEDNGDDFDWPPGTGVTGLAVSPKGGAVAEDWSFSGSRSEDAGGGLPAQTWHWALGPAG